MHKLPSEAVAWLDGLQDGLLDGLLGRLGSAGLESEPADDKVQLVLNVPATHLHAMAVRLQGAQLQGARLELGGQDLSPHDQGAYTGEISGAMLRDAGAAFVIVGHSERRAHHQESDHLVNAKIRAARRHGLVPILCVGETDGQRDAGEAQAVVVRQLEGALEGVELMTADDLVVAYEPIWAIGTGRTATAEDAQQMCADVRRTLAQLHPRHAAGIRVLYGGSMKPSNATELLARADIDGGLIGGASLEIDDLLALVRAAR